MAPTEASILSNFLLSPAPFTTIISLQQFTDLFPRPHRANPQIKLLYRELQHLRALDLDEVRANVAREVGRGEKQKQELRKARRSAKDALPVNEDAREAQMDSHMFDSTSNLRNDQPYTQSSIAGDLHHACGDLELEISTLEAEIRGVSEDLESTIGDLSDLRYGKFGQTPGSDSVTEKVVEGLQRLEEACKDRLAR